MREAALSKRKHVLHQKNSFLAGRAHRGCGQTGCGGIAPINKHVDVRPRVDGHVRLRARTTGNIQGLLSDGWTDFRAVRGR